MAIYEIGQHKFHKVEETTFQAAGIRERYDLQRLLREQIDVISPETLVLCEEFGDWEDSRRRIDILGLDKDANLVVIELKRTEDGGHMDLQAIRYAAMVSTMTFEKVVQVFGDYLAKSGSRENASNLILEFLGWAEPDENSFAQEVRIILASAEFSKELTTAVLWLNDRGLDIRCIRLQPFNSGQQLFMHVAQVVPLPEATEYQVRLREKTQMERIAKASQRDYSRFDVNIDGDLATNLNKRQAIYRIISHLIRNGVSPARISALLDWRGPRLFYSVDGILASEEFLAAAESAQNCGDKKGRFDPVRYFHRDSELFAIPQEGKTYALNNQWGPRTEQAMSILAETFADQGIAFSKK